MSDLTPIPNSTAIKQTLTGLSPALKALLGVEPSSLRAVSEIASSPALLAEARAVLPVLKAHATAPATPDEIRQVVGAKFATYRQPARSDAEWVAFWEDHFTVLADVSLSALESALDVILKDPTIEFLPKPAKLRELARMTPNRAVRAHDRAKAALEHQPPRAPNPGDTDPNYIAPAVRGVIRSMAPQPRVEPSAADKERVRQQMREFIAQDDARKAALKAKTPEPGNTAGPIDETGLTPQMRAKLSEGRAA